MGPKGSLQMLCLDEICGSPERAPNLGSAQERLKAKAERTSRKRASKTYHSQQQLLGASRPQKMDLDFRPYQDKLSFVENMFDLALCLLCFSGLQGGPNGGFSRCRTARGSNEGERAI